MLSRVTLAGNLGRDPELVRTPGGRAVTNLSLATHEAWTDKEGQRKQQTEWHRVVVWGKRAERAAGPLRKGPLVQQAAEKGPTSLPAASAAPGGALARSGGAATYGPSTPRTSHRTPPCIWTFLRSLRKGGVFSKTVIQWAAPDPNVEGSGQSGGHQHGDPGGSGCVPGHPPAA